MGDFKKLRIWNDAVNLATKIYQESNDNMVLSRDYGLKDQMQRASVSIASNIAEGEERKTDKEAIYFLNVAKGSSAELYTQLTIAYRSNIIGQDTFVNVTEDTERIRAGIIRLILRKENKPLR